MTGADVFALPWGALAAARVAAYRASLLRVHQLGAPTLSVGALEMGGTGKTPVVAAVVGLLGEAGRKAAVLSRGFGRTGSAPCLVSDGVELRCAVRAAGDEPAWYARALPGTVVAVAARREDAARLAGRLAPDLFVLDDGFQHVRVARDLDLLVVDADRPFYRASPPPFGRLREWPAAAGRADGYVVHGDHRGEIAAELERRFPGRPCFQMQRRFDGLADAAPWTGQPPGTTAAPQRAYAFAGIARPGRFFRSLDGAVTVHATRAFPDHHWYSDDDREAIEQAASHCGADALVTTEKDAVRLSALHFRHPLWVWRYRLVATAPDRLREWLLGHLFSGNGGVE